jgi:predicted dehydrogenase
MKRVRVGIIGAGMAWERLHWPAFRELQSEYEIVAVCDITRDKAVKWANLLGLGEENAYGDHRQLLERLDVEAVDIMVPIDLNYELAQIAAQAGKAIILEKPLAPNIEQAKACLELPEKYNIPMLIAENFRYSEEYNALRDLVYRKRIGEPIYAIAHNASCFPCSMTKDTFAATEWRQHPGYPGGDLLDAGVHDLAGLRHVFGAVRSVHALGEKLNYADYSPYKSFHVNMLFHSGVVAQYTFNTLAKEIQRPLIGTRIFGTQGEIYLEERSCGIINLFLPGTHEEVPYRPDRGYYNELKNFYLAITGQEPIAVTPEMEYGDVRTVFAVLESLAKETVVEVDPVSEYSPTY